MSPSVDWTPGGGYGTYTLPGAAQPAVSYGQILAYPPKPALPPDYVPTAPARAALVPAMPEALAPITLSPEQAELADAVAASFWHALCRLLDRRISQAGFDRRLDGIVNELEAAGYR